MLVLEGLIGLLEPFNFSFFSITGQGIDLDYCDIEWFALETNRDHSVIFEITSKYYKPHVQGVAAARVQEGREELLHVQDQEG